MTKKEPFVSIKEPCITELNEGSVLQCAATISFAKKALYTRQRGTYPPKSPSNPPKIQHTHQKGLHIRKRAVHIHKRALHNQIE